MCDSIFNVENDDITVTKDAIVEINGEVKFVEMGDSIFKVPIAKHIEKKQIYVVHEDQNIDVMEEEVAEHIRENRSCFTLSFEQGKPGWHTDGGYPGYGLTYKVACKIVNLINEQGGIEITDEDLEDRS